MENRIRIELGANNPLVNSSFMMEMGQDMDENGLFPGGATIEFPIKEIRESTGVPEILSMVLSFTGQAVTVVAFNIFSNWLWDKLTQKKGKKIEIDGLVIDFNDKSAFKRILADKIRIEE